MVFTIFADISGSILATTHSFGNVSAKVMTWVTAPVLLGLTLLIMWHGFNIIRGTGGNHHLIDVFMKCMRVFLVFSLALGGSAYTENVSQFVGEMRTGLTEAFTPSSTTDFMPVEVTIGGSNNLSSYTALDRSMSQALTCFDQILTLGWDHISIGFRSDLTGVVMIFCGAFMVGCLLIYALVAAVNLLLIDFSMVILWGVGPIFIACFAFESTAKFFDTWFNSVLKYVFTAVVIAAVIGMGNGILAGYAAKLASSHGNIDFIVAAFSALAASGILIALATKAPAIAGDIIGGNGISIFSPAAAMSSVSSAASSIKSGGAAAASAAKSGGAAVANAASYGVGKMAGSRIDNLASQGSQSSLGKKALDATAGLRNFGNAVSGKIAGNASSNTGGTSARSKPNLGATMSNAYKIGKTSNKPRPRPTPFPTINMNR